MSMFSTLNRRRKRKKKIADLRRYIESTLASELKDATTPQEKGEAYDVVHAICEEEEHELEYLLQEEILEKLRSAPFDVPDEYWYDYGESRGWYKKTLTSRGEAWARHELKKIRRADVEFWFKLVLPVAAFIISIMALIRKR